jgi:hypothetical protein
MSRNILRLVLALVFLLCLCAPAAATYMDDVGYTALKNELGSSLLTGAGVQVTQIESAGMPDPNNAQFTGKTLTPKSSSMSISSHATAVGQYFYGKTSSFAPGITNIDCYLAMDWLSNFLGGSAPQISSSRVANHSYVGTGFSTQSYISYLARTDWLVNRDEYIQVVAMNNGGSNTPMMGSSFNAISVGLSNGTAAHGSYPLVTSPTTPYALAGTRPDLVAPAGATSWATPMVASAAALLVAEGHNNPGLSRDPLVNYTTNRAGATIYNAERSEVVKAALMAGASRTSPNLTNSVTPNGYTVNTANGLNNVYGAGQLNIYNSYHIIAGGEQNSREDYPTGLGKISAAGFDYDPYFGGLNGSNRTGSYVFQATSTGTLSASLVWNLDVNGPTTSTTSTTSGSGSTSSTGGKGGGKGSKGSGNGGKTAKSTTRLVTTATTTTSCFDTTATLYNLGLYLYDTTSGAEVAYAASLVDNTQNIYYTSLTAGDSYLLEVASLEATDFLWDYALAWNITADINTLTSSGAAPAASFLIMGAGAGIGTATSTPLPPTVYLLGSGIAALLLLRRKRKGYSL